MRLQQLKKSIISIIQTAFAKHGAYNYSHAVNSQRFRFGLRFRFGIAETFTYLLDCGNMDAQARRFRLKTQAFLWIMKLHRRSDFLLADLACILRQPQTPCYNGLGALLESPLINPRLIASTLGMLHVEQLQQLVEFFPTS